MLRDQRIKQNYKELSHIDNSNHLTTKRLYVKFPENVNDDTIRRRSCISPIIARKSIQIEKALEQRTQSVGNIGKDIWKDNFVFIQIIFPINTRFWDLDKSNILFK